MSSTYKVRSRRSFSHQYELGCVVDSVPPVALKFSHGLDLPSPVTFVFWMTVRDVF